MDALWDDPSLQGPREAMRNVRCAGNQGALGPQGGATVETSRKKKREVGDRNRHNWALWYTQPGCDIHSLPW